MKTNLLLLTMLFLTSLNLASAKAVGTEGGGGGDELEDRVNTIRFDIYKWIENGGSEALILPEDMTLEQYNQDMQEILARRRVLVSFVENDLSDDEELRVIVNGIPKTCRGFISKKDLKEHIVCNVTRFRGTSESGQYRLIHHEYAGLAMIEKNEGALSDYSISSQITDYLVPQSVLRLAVKSKAVVALASEVKSDTQIKKPYCYDFKDAPTFGSGYIEFDDCISTENDAEVLMKAFMINLNAHYKNLKFHSKGILKYGIQRVNSYAAFPKYGIMAMIPMTTKDLKSIMTATLNYLSETQGCKAVSIKPKWAESHFTAREEREIYSILRTLDETIRCYKIN
jgi:hypothetical protein